MKKIIALLMAVMMLATVAVGCNGNGGETTNTGETTGNADATATGEWNVSASDFGDEKDATIKVWGPDAYVSLLKEQCDAFTNMFPEQNISIEVVAQGEDVATTQLLSDSEAAADVFGFASDQMNRLTNAQVIAPVVTGYAENIKKTDLEDAVEVSSVDGKLYAYPETGNGYTLVYDKRVVTDEQAGSLEAILEACKAQGKKFIMEAGTGYYACSFAFTGGLALDGLEDDNATQKFAEYDEAEVVATLKAFSKLMHDYSGTFTSLGVVNISSGFTNGACGAGIDGIWNAEANKKALGENLGAAKLPTINVDGEDKQMISMYGYKMIGVNAHSKYPRTAQILAYYLTSKECQEQRLEQMGWTPTNKEVAESDAAKDNVVASALLDQAQYSVKQVNISEILWNPMSNLGNKLIDADTDPETYDFATLLKETIANITAK